MPRIVKVQKYNPPGNNWGGKRESSKVREPRNTVLDAVERSAGDWIPAGETEMEIPDSPDFFYISEMLRDGFSICIPRCIKG
jgi:hypothetical protein